MRIELLKRSVAVLFAVVVLAGTSGCATVFCGPHQRVKIESVPAGADFKIEQVAVDGMLPFSKGVTPSSVSLKRTRSYLVTLSKPGYESNEIVIEYGRPNPWCWGNFITFPVGTLIGLAIDGYSGSSVILEPGKVREQMLPLVVNNGPRRSAPGALSKDITAQTGDINSKKNAGRE